jgi:hypothetical protein
VLVAIWSLERSETSERRASDIALPTVIAMTSPTSPSACPPAHPPSEKRQKTIQIDARNVETIYVTVPVDGIKQQQRQQQQKT